MEDLEKEIASQKKMMQTLKTKESKVFQRIRGA